MPTLSRPQIIALTAALKHGGATFAVRGVRGRAGGAHRRMCERMADEGLLECSAPFAATAKGAEAAIATLAELERLGASRPLNFYHNQWTDLRRALARWKQSHEKNRRRK